MRPIYHIFDSPYDSHHISRQGTKKAVHIRLIECGRLFGRGGYLLSHFRSIIDVVRFNFSVRNGKRWSPHAIATLSSFAVSAVFLDSDLYKVKRVHRKRVPSFSFNLATIYRLTCPQPPYVCVVRRIKSEVLSWLLCRTTVLFTFLFWDVSQERVWAISIARLNALLRIHLRPIYVIVSDGPYVEILS